MLSFRRILKKRPQLLLGDPRVEPLALIKACRILRPAYYTPTAAQGVAGNPWSVVPRRRDMHEGERP